MKLEKIETIISGGQTGADRAAFDFALKNKIKIGGFVPKGRRAEDGKIPLKYTNVVETETRNYAVRTELNVQNSDATLILSHGKLTGGSLLTRKLAKKHKKPFLHIDFESLTLKKAVEKMREWLDLIDCKSLNIAGARASSDAKIYDKITRFLKKLFSVKENQKG